MVPDMSVDDEALGRAVKAAQWRHHRGLDSRLREIGSTIVQWDALRAIDANPGASAHELAQLTFQSDQSFGTLAGRLIKLGLVERSPGHGRRIVHTLTPAGEQLLADGRRIARAFFADSFAGLSDRERAQLLGLLDRLGADSAARVG